MFDIKTPKRTYYLAAESEEDMNKWVDFVCHVCGLKPFTVDENAGKYLFLMFFFYFFSLNYILL